MKTRLLGLLLIAVGLGVGYFMLWSPLEEARAGVSQVKYDLRAFILVPISLVFGPFMVIGGRSLIYRSNERDNLSNLSIFGWFLFAITVALSAYGYYWFQQQFATFGYR